MAQIKAGASLKKTEVRVKSAVEASKAEAPKTPSIANEQLLRRSQATAAAKAPPASTAQDDDEWGAAPSGANVRPLTPAEAQAQRNLINKATASKATGSGNKQPSKSNAVKAYQAKQRAAAAASEATATEASPASKATPPPEPQPKSAPKKAAAKPAPTPAPESKPEPAPDAKPTPEVEADAKPAPVSRNALFASITAGSKLKSVPKEDGDGSAAKPARPVNVFDQIKAGSKLKSVSKGDGEGLAATKPAPQLSQAEQIAARLGAINARRRAAEDDGQVSAAQKNDLLFEAIEQQTAPPTDTPPEQQVRLFARGIADINRLQRQVEAFSNSESPEEKSQYTARKQRLDGIQKQRLAQLRAFEAAGNKLPDDLDNAKNALQVAIRRTALDPDSDSDDEEKDADFGGQASRPDGIPWRIRHKRSVRIIYVSPRQIILRIHNDNSNTPVLIQYPARNGTTIRIPFSRNFDGTVILPFEGTALDPLRGISISWDAEEGQLTFLSTAAASKNA